ncbi:hypothetical protein VTK56DRAFT_9601 [Thermocarpiscus australiensis]
MAIINCDITVLIAERVDMDSMLPLMLTCKANYQLVKNHRRSIVKARIANTIHDPLLRPPFGTLLSSLVLDRRAHTRKVLKPLNSLAVAKEVELRARQIDSLFGPKSAGPCGQPLIKAISQLVHFHDLPPNQMERLVDGFRDACMVADRIADCAAAVQLKKSFGIDRFSHRGYMIEYQVHLDRQEFIRSLSPLRLAFLALLASLAGMSYARSLPCLDSDPFQWERVIAFKEAFLRHGTVVLYALLCPSEADGKDMPSETRPGASLPPHARSGLARYYASEVSAVLEELLEYENSDWGSSTSADAEDNGTGGDIPDGLHMTLLEAFPLPEEVDEEDAPQDEGAENGDEAHGVDDDTYALVIGILDAADMVDASWLFNIDIWSSDSDNVDDNFPPPALSRWIRGTL